MICQKEADKLWKHLFREKIPRLMDSAFEKSSIEQQVLLIKICYEADSAIRAKLYKSDDRKVNRFVAVLWPYLEDPTFLETQLKLNRMAKWYKRIGLAEKIWETI